MCIFTRYRAYYDFHSISSIGFSLDIEHNNFFVLSVLNLELFFVNFEEPL